MIQSSCCHNCPDRAVHCRQGCQRAAEETILRMLQKASYIKEKKKQRDIVDYEAKNLRRIKDRKPHMHHRHP